MTLVAPPALARRAAMLSLPALALAPLAARAQIRQPTDAQRAEWDAFRDRFVLPDGRVIEVTAKAGDPAAIAAAVDISNMIVPFAIRATK